MCQIDASLRTRLKGWYRCITFRRAKSFNDSWRVPGAEQTSAPEEHQLMANGHATVNIEDVAGDKRSCV
jgi:hypothetical protein